MKESIDIKGLLQRIFIPTAVFSLSYFVLGHFCHIPQFLLFCIMCTFILMPMELGMILKASKREFGKASLKSAFVGQEKSPIWKTVVWALAFFGLAILLSTFVLPVENQIFAGISGNIFNHLPKGFNWMDIDYLKSFPRPVLITTCVWLVILNVVVEPITEELFFRGYLTSHYEKQNAFAPILIAILFSLYHLWLPFQNVYRILAFAPMAYVTYKQKNLYISILFHCLCGILSSVWLVGAIL